MFFTRLLVIFKWVAVAVWFYETIFWYQMLTDMLCVISYMLQEAAAKGEAPPGLHVKRTGQDSQDKQPKVFFFALWFNFTYESLSGVWQSAMVYITGNRWLYSKTKWCLVWWTLGAEERENSEVISIWEITWLGFALCKWPSFAFILCIQMTNYTNWEGKFCGPYTSVPLLDLANRLNRFPILIRSGINVFLHFLLLSYHSIYSWNFTWIKIIFRNI